MKKYSCAIAMFLLSGFTGTFASPVLISLSDYNVLSGSGVETTEDFESFTPFNPFTHNLWQLPLANGVFNGTDPDFTGGLSVRVEPGGNQYLADNGIDEPQTFNAFPTNTTVWAVDIRWLSAPDPGGKFRLDATSTTGSSTFFLDGNACNYIAVDCPTIGTSFSFVGLYDPDGLTSVTWQQYPGIEQTSGFNTWVGYGYDNVRTVSAVPLPTALWLFGSGLLGLAGMARRKKAA